MKLRPKTYSSGRKGWEVDLGVIAGRRVQKYFPNRAVAEDFLARAKARKREEGNSAFILSAQQQQEYLECVHRLPPGATLTQAVDLFLEAQPKIGPTRPLHELLELFLTAKAAQAKREKYIRLLRCTVGAFLEAHRDKTIWELTREVAVGYVTGNNYAPKTQKNLIGDFRAFFEWCRGAGYLDKNPLAGDKVQLVQVERDTEISCLGVDQARALLRAALRPEHRHLMGYLAAAMFCGIRPSEIEESPLASLDLKGRTFRVKGLHAKTRGRRVIELPSVAAVWFRLWRWDCPKQAEFMGPNFRQQWVRLRKDAGLGVWAHDVLRHTCGSFHLAAYQNLALIQAILGHSQDEDTFYQHYRATQTLAGETITKRMGLEFWALTPKRVACKSP